MPGRPPGEAESPPIRRPAGRCQHRATCRSCARDAEIGVDALHRPQRLDLRDRGHSPTFVAASSAVLGFVIASLLRSRQVGGQAGSGVVSDSRTSRTSRTNGCFGWSDAVFGWYGFGTAGRLGDLGTALDGSISQPSHLKSGSDLRKHRSGTAGTAGTRRRPRAGSSGPRHRRIGAAVALGLTVCPVPGGGSERMSKSRSRRPAHRGQPVGRYVAQGPRCRPSDGPGGRRWPAPRSHRTRPAVGSRRVWR